MDHHTEEEKARNKQLKGEAKAAKAEEKRLAKEEHAFDEDPHPDEKATGETTTSSSSHKRRLSRPFTPKIQTKGAPSTATNNNNTSRNEASPLSPMTSPDSANDSAAGRVKNWLRSRLHKPRAKSISAIKSGNSNRSNDGKSTNSGAGQQGGFIGGHALTRFHHADGTGSMTSLSEGPTPLSMREVALAGRRPLSSSPPLHHHYQAFADEPGESSRTSTAYNTNVNRRSYGRVGSNPTSFASSGSSTIEEQEEQQPVEGETKRESRARDRTKRPEPLHMDIVPPRTLVDPARVSKSPNRDSKFIEIME